MARQWKPGESPYADWLKSLTPEEYEAHLEQRRKKKAMRQAMETVVKQNQELWLAELNNTAAELLKKAQTEGDVQAFVAVWDRVVGKPKDEVNLDTNKPLPWNDDLD